jgi:phosphate transport system substrate-binding protein
MKKWFMIFLIGGILFSRESAIAQTAREEPEIKGTITISGAWALYPMAVKWAEEFQKQYAQVNFDISAGGAGKGMVDCLAEVVDIGMVSRDIYPEEINKGAWWVSVVKDAVVPTLNAKNPIMKELMTTGLKRETLIGIWITAEVTTWGQVIGQSLKHPIHVYTRSDACGAGETWAKYLGGHQEDLHDVGVYGDPGLAEAVRNDGLGIGYNNINYVYDSKTKQPAEGLQVLPIDVNENGLLDADENFYTNRDLMIQAISKGKYPSPPARDLHLVTHGNPKNPIVRRFIDWVLTDGQKYVSAAGYIQLSHDKLNQELKKLAIQPE